MFDVDIEYQFEYLRPAHEGRSRVVGCALQNIRWYLAYSLSYRDIEEIMKERGFEVDHSTIQRWVVHYSPKLEKAFYKKNETVW